MTWLDLIGAVGVLLAITAVIGGAVAWAVGLRGLWLLAAAPAFFATITAGAAVVAPWLGLGWSLLPVAIVAVLIGGVSAAIRVVVGRRRPRTPVPPRRFDIWVLIALALPAAVLVWRCVEILGAPGSFSQTFDNIFHLNGVRYVLDTANASSLHLGFMTSPSGSLAFYPAAWHGVVALIVQLTGVTIPVATNAMIIVVSAGIWPVGAVLLARTLAGARPAVAIAAGAVAAGVPAFPILLLDYGVLYPLMYGLALLPFALAVGVGMLGVAKDSPHLDAGWWILVFAGAIGGMTLAHPGAFVALLALSAPMVCAVVVRALRRRGWRRRALTIAGFLSYLVAGVLLLKVLRPPLGARGWPLSQSMGDAVLTALAGSMWYQVPAYAAAVLVILGIVWTLIDRTREAWLMLAMYVIGAWLYVVVVALPIPNLRDAFTGSWYNNAPRLAAIFVVALLPLAAYGAARTWTWLRARIPADTRQRVPRGGAIAAGVAAAVALVAVAQIGAVPRAVEWASSTYRMTAESALVSSDEYALLTRLDEEVPESAVVAGDPFAGAALAYALADRRVLLPHALVEMDDARTRIVAALREGRFDAAACRAANEDDVRYVLDFGTAGVHGPIEGYSGLGDSSQLTLIDEQGDARLYELTGCSLAG
ncbi:DUF6541 family protein [Microbacterium sp. Clip185]|uniref:DUF6541 family protein n=1 Tax=Microbacterium sp. Clip185 TaxID=3025663 RepID=UPI00236559FF|nr:DUF6541 family protein [Microbacterium sp. Clip185]WDG18958.1 hypothetical protein PQV94_04255 [Microbacterium sp. Clip185]